MPYITKKDREKYDAVLDNLPNIEHKGDLEYCIFKLMVKYKDSGPQRYAHLHDTTYAAAHCADEFRRRFLDNREDFAKEANGDIK